MKQKAKNSFDFLTISRSVAILTAVSNKIKTRGHVLFKDFGNSLKAGLIVLVKGAELLAVDIDDGYHLVATDNGNDNLGVGPRRTCDVTGELMYVGHDERLCVGPRLTTDAAALGNAVAGHRTLERAELQLAIADEVEPHPEVIGQLLLEQGGDIGQRPYPIVNAVDQTPHLLGELAVSLFLVHSHLISASGAF